MASKYLITLARFTRSSRPLPNSTIRALLTSASGRTIQHGSSSGAWGPNKASRTHQHTQIRWHSAPLSKTQVYDFSGIQSLASKPSTDRILIDVREPSEYEPGHIPTSINIPIKSAPEAMLLPADEFEDRFGFEKPRADQEVVFYCKAGVRSSAAAKLAEQAGYRRIGEYRGSWLDWEKNAGEVEK